MNKKEVAEIKKNFSDSSGLFVLNSVLTAYIDADKNLRYHNVQSGAIMPVEDKDVIYSTLKRVLSTKVGTNLIEYTFPTTNESDTAQNILIRLLKSELKDENVIDLYLSRVVDNITYIGPFVLITAYCTYTAYKTTASGGLDDFNDEVYNYMITAICPVSTSNDGFIFDSFNNEIVKKLNTELVIDDKPTDGFIFPVFSNRSSDINHVMYYSKSASKPNISFVEDVLDCEFVMTSENQRACFQQILKDVIGEDLNYMFIVSVNEKLKDIIEINKNDTDIVTIDNQQLREIFRDCGASLEKLDIVDVVYDKICNGSALAVTNLIEPKMSVDVCGVTVNANLGNATRVRTTVSDGRKRLLIDLDESTIYVNGLPITLT